MVMGLSRFPSPIYFVRRQCTGDFYLFFLFFLIFGVFCARNVFICLNRAWRGFRGFRISQA